MKTSCKPQSILYPQPVLVIASYDKEGHADAMVAAWGGIYDTNQIGFMPLGEAVGKAWGEGRIFMK